MYRAVVKTHSQKQELVYEEVIISVILDRLQKLAEPLFPHKLDRGAGLEQRSPQVQVSTALVQLPAAQPEKQKMVVQVHGFWLLCERPR